MLQNEKVPYMNVEEYLCKFLDKNSLKKIKEATIEELEKYLPYDIAINLKEYLNNN